MEEPRRRSSETEDLTQDAWTVRRAVEIIVMMRMVEWRRRSIHNVCGYYDLQMLVLRFEKKASIGNIH